MDVIGSGTEGKVYKAECAKKYFALKEIKQCFKINLKIYENINKNENLVQFIETFDEK